MPNDVFAIKSALLRYYSTECLYHVAFIFTIFTSFYYFFQLKIVADLLLPFPEIWREYLAKLIWSVVLGLVVTGTLRLFFRMLRWGYLAHEIIIIAFTPVEYPDFDQVLSSRLLHEACSDHVRQKHPSLWMLSASSRRSIYGWVLVFLAFPLSTLIFPSFWNALASWVRAR